MFRGVCVALAACALAAGWTLAPSAGAATGSGCTIVGTSGNDVLRGTPGPDVICGKGGDDELIGLAGNDVLRGGGGDDLLLGGGGSDTLVGGGGRNTLRGGPGDNSCREGIAWGCLAQVKRTAARAASSDPTPLPPRPGEPMIPAMPPCVECGAPPPDREPPTFFKLDLDRAVRIDPAGGDIGFWLHAWDDRGAFAATLNIAGPDGSPWKSIALPEAEAFSRHGEIEVPAGSPLGAYSIESVELVDTAGNRTTVDHEALAGELDDDEFAAYEGEDTEPPSLEDFSLTPSSAESGDEAIQFSVGGRATDGQSGLKNMWVTVMLPNHAPPYTYSLSHQALLRSGTQLDGLRTGSFELAQWAYPGVYRVTEIELEDFAGNALRLEAPELEARGYPLSFEVTGSGDTTPPEILGVSVSPETIPASGGTVESLIHVRDDLSGLGTWPEQGLSDVYDSFAWPPHDGPTQWTGEAPRLVSGTDLDGTWRVITTLDGEAPAGRYSLQWVGAYDRAGNGGPTYLPELEARGWALGFTKLP